MARDSVADVTDSARDHDVVVYGATGFVGVLTAKYLAEHAPADARIALGGRLQAKLEQSRAELGVEWPLVIADSQDHHAVAALAGSAHVVATTVGPYFKYGKPLVEACAAVGTHYADLTGEVLFMRWAIDTADAAARASGARIVHTCGFDSIPSDIGVLLLHEAAKAGGHGELEETSLVVKSWRGGASGGTIDSLRTAVDTVKKDPASRRLVLDPYSLSPNRAAEPDLGPERDPVKPLRDDRLGGWLAPFVMGSVNTRVVRRSNALQGHAYGRRFRYRELMLTGSGLAGGAKAAGVAGGIAGALAGFAIPGVRQMLDRILPDPGEGPSERARERGFFNIDIHTTTSSGERLRCEIRVQGDPGYKATAVMLGESALCLSTICPRRRGCSRPRRRWVACSRTASWRPGTATASCPIDGRVPDVDLIGCAALSPHPNRGFGGSPGASERGQIRSPHALVERFVRGPRRRLRRR